MPTEASATALSRRVAALSPEKRALLERRLLRNPANGAASPNEEIPAQPRGDRRDFPLSSAQERMWFNHQWSPEQPLYNESLTLRLDGEVRAELLVESFGRVMARHESFSTTFHCSEGRLFQRNSSCPLPQLAVRDLRDLDSSRSEAAYLAEAEAFALGRKIRVTKVPSWGTI